MCDTFSKHGKLNPRYIDPFEILARVEPVALRLELPSGLSSVRNVFMCNVKKWHADEAVAIPPGEIQNDECLNLVEKPIEMMKHEIRRL